MESISLVELLVHINVHVFYKQFYFSGVIDEKTNFENTFLHLYGNIENSEQHKAQPKN